MENYTAPILPHKDFEQNWIDHIAKEARERRIANRKARPIPHTHYYKKGTPERFRRDI